MGRNRKCKTCKVYFYGPYSWCSAECMERYKQDSLYKTDEFDGIDFSTTTYPPEVADCKSCKNKIEGQSKFYPYCSFKCKNICENEVKICPVCEDKFVQLSFNQICCSKKCGTIRTKKIYEESRKITLYRIFQRDDFCCIYCGSSPLSDSKVKLVIDHVYPMVKGGRNDLFNLATCCQECNGNKSASMLSEIQIKEIWKRNEAKNKSSPEIMASYQELVTLFDKAYFSRLEAV